MGSAIRLTRRADRPSAMEGHLARDLPDLGHSVSKRDAGANMVGDSMDEIDVHLGRRLRRRRRLLGLTQQELAASCGVRFQQIQKYECAANRMSAARLWQLAEVLEGPVSYFYEGLTREQREEWRDRDAG